MEQPLSGGLETPVLDNIRTFLSVMATELHETILRLERTTARVTELTAFAPVALSASLSSPCRISIACSRNS